MIQQPIPNELRHEVAQRAYEIYELRGGWPGSEIDDWLQAEREILNALEDKDLGQLSAIEDTNLGGKDSVEPKTRRKKSQPKSPAKRKKGEK